VEISARKFNPGGGHCGGHFIHRIMADSSFFADILKSKIALFRFVMRVS